ncbi:twin-arginine translocation signal domain-containing protein [Candidatus Poribacteria bacterium]|nr:twin-arginine translocation signal domain-containing protein [Candidatus Poribacteria bacterium]
MYTRREFLGLSAAAGAGLLLPVRAAPSPGATAIPTATATEPATDPAMSTSTASAGKPTAPPSARARSATTSATGRWSHSLGKIASVGSPTSKSTEREPSLHCVTAVQIHTLSGQPKVL